jgi:hypothetical protein
VTTSCLRRSRAASSLALLVVAGLACADDVAMPSPAPSTSSATIVRELIPSSGMVSGGTRVTVVGSGFLTVTSVTFGGVPGTDLRVRSDRELLVVTPPGAKGEVEVQVRNALGVAGLQPGRFRYLTVEEVTECPGCWDY